MAVRRLTVSEFIRESKPDWKHVAARYPRGHTQPYSGPLQVNVLAPEPLAAQAERQASGEEEGVALWDEIEEVAEETESEPSPGSSVPRG